MSPKVTTYINTSTSWKKELQLLRSYLKDTKLTEEFKWSSPCYTLNGKNVLMIVGFKDTCTCGHSKKMPICDGSHKLYGGR